MSFALVVTEEHPRRAVELAHDDALRTIDDEGAGLSHERHLADIDFLLPGFLELFLPVGVCLEHIQFYADLEGRGKGYALLQGLPH